MKTFGTSIVASMIVVGCFAPHLKAGDREHLGKWHDGPRDMAAWYVCEKADLDGCSEAGWSVFEGSCYAVSEELKSYDDAAAACEAQTAQLVSIQSAEENAHVQSLCKRRACWLGLSEPADSENWFWADGAPGGTKGKWVGYVNWEKGEPNNYFGRDEEATFLNFWGHLGVPPPEQQEMMQTKRGVE
ncbi:MAG: C-type lectin domain-containing protein, partial [Nitrospiraceae bacterium]